MGTPINYARRVPPEKWTPPDKKVAARIAALRAQQTEIDRLEAAIEKIKAAMKPEIIALTDKTGINMPVAVLAEELGVQRKTVYRHAGRKMS